MDSALANLSKSDLIALLEEEKKTVARYERKVNWLQTQLAQFQRMLFGQKRERFEANPDQISLPLDATEKQKKEQEEVHEQTVTYVRSKQSRGNHKGRLPLPEHLPVEEIKIYPEGDLSDMDCIGSEVTEQLEFEPGHFYIKRYIRYKYARKAKDTEGVVIGELPEGSCPFRVSAVYSSRRSATYHFSI